MEVMDHSSVLESRQSYSKFLNIKLNPGISVVNLLTYYLSQFVVFTCLSFVLTFTTFILRDPNYYAIDENEIGGDLGTISAYVEVIVIIEGLFMGPLFDTLGRKVPMVMGFLLTGIAIWAIPMFTSLYSQGKQKEASKLFDKISLVVGIIVFSLITNIIFFSKELLWIWTGDIDIADSAYQYVPFMAISYGMLSLAIIPFNVAIANGYTKLNNQLGLISLFLTIPGYLIATKYFNAIGAAVVYCFVQTTITIIYLYIINKKFIKNQSFVSMLFKQIIKPLFISFSIVLLLSFIPRIFQYSRFLSLIWIGFSLIITIVATLLILIPLDKLNFKKEII